MNILYTITSYPPAVGGTQFHTHQLASRMVEVGHKVQVATFWDRTRHDWLLGTTLTAPSGSLQAYTAGDVRVNRLGLSRREKLGLLPFVAGYWLFQGPAIRRISSLLAGKLGAIGQEWHVVHNVRQGREGLSYASLRLARTLGIPFVFTPVHHPRWGGWLHRHYRSLYRAADALIALTHVEKETLVGLGGDPGRIHVTGIGPVLAPRADGPGFRLAHDLGSDPVVLFLGTHYPYKGVDLVLGAAQEVWSAFPTARFVFAGPPTDYSRRLFARHADPRLVQLGTVDLKTKTDALVACDLLCVPSTQESFGGVYTEAWMMGRPVIGGDIPAVREVVCDGADGYLVGPDPSQVAARICALLQDPDLRQRMGQTGRAKVLANYTWERLAVRTEEVYLHTRPKGA